MGRKGWKCTSKIKKQSNKNSLRTMKRRDRKHWKDLCPSRDFQWFHGDFRTLPCFAFTRNDERNAIDLSGVAFPKKCFISMWQCVSSEGTEGLLFSFVFKWRTRSFYWRKVAFVVSGDRVKTHRKFHSIDEDQKFLNRLQFVKMALKWFLLHLFSP